MAASAEMPHLRRATAGLAPSEDRLASIDRKLDVLTEQIAYLHKRTAAVEELKDELVPIVRDAMGAVSEELGVIEHEFNTEEVVYLLRKVLRNTPRFIRLLDRLESLDGLAAELEPLGKEVVRTVVGELESIEKRGHFRVARGGLEAFDRVVAHTTQEDVDRLVDNATLVADTLGALSRPEVLAFAKGAADALAETSTHEPERVGTWQLLGAMRDERVQAGLGVALAVLRRLGGQALGEIEGKDAAEARISDGERKE